MHIHQKQHPIHTVK